ncbi:MAG: hypothetical protein LUO79_02705 [Methanomassiliicoccales archaeon]|nr:hypothetical protein [Methanomassiliicoccales archaeon]
MSSRAIVHLNRERVVSILGHGRLSTAEIERELGADYADCPDEIARQLARMRREGLIKGEVSKEKGGWVWWIDEG